MILVFGKTGQVFLVGRWNISKPLLQFQSMVFHQ